MTTVTDPDKGTVTKVTDPVGQEVNSQYDALRRLTKTSTMLTATQEVKTENTYQAQTGYLASTTHNTDSSGGSVTYNFAYDTLGRQVSVAVGSNVLSTTYYDAQGKPAIVIFNGTAYGYLYNLQGDVVALIDGTGGKVVEYGYDAWGKPISKTGTMASTLGTVQPFRYRGYVWDEETGDYYLRSRYYRPEWSRFISADRLLAKNIYEYCQNAPVKLVDPNGTHPIIIIIALASALGGILAYESYVENELGDVNAVEKKYIANHPYESYRAKQLSEIAGQLTNKYWGDNASNVDISYANAFKHTLWCALMTRDLGPGTAFTISTNHEYWDYDNPSEYSPWGTNTTTTVAEASRMDMINNEHGINIGRRIPFYLSDDEVARIILADMLLNPGDYFAIETEEYSHPVEVME